MTGVRKEEAKEEWGRSQERRGVEERLGKVTWLDENQLYICLY